MGLDGGAAGGAAAPQGGKGKKGRGQGQGKRIRSAKDKKDRIWGKTPKKPYISSSLGDMTRVMMRYACMENTYFYNNEPPPVEFYDFWQKFSVDPSHYPQDFVDTKKASIPNLRMNTSSFDFFGQYAAPIQSTHEMEEGGTPAAPKAKKIVTTDAQRISDIWKGVRISMSTESFISSSTKISEDGSQVPLETGWEEACSEDYQSSESDFGLDVQDRNRHHRHKQLFFATGGDSQANQDEKHSSLEFHTAQGLIDKQANAIAQSILAMQKRDNRILYELATRPRDLDIIDHFADDLDDSFLIDAISYSELPDEAFGADFDFFNEDLLYKKKGKKGKKVAKDKRMSTKGAAEDNLVEEMEDDDEDDKDSSESECPEDMDLECVTKGKKGEVAKQKSTAVKQVDEDTSAVIDGGYAACMERRRKRIEDTLKAAVRKRSPMGSYRPVKGEEPLTKALANNTPGPAAYNPQISGVKPNIHTALLAPRWTKNIYETPGPGPAAYIPDPKCTCEMLTLHEAPRFKEDETVGPGPANVNLSNYAGTAKDKPKAIIISRKNRGMYVNGARFTNCYGLTRFGPANPPRAIIMGKHDPRNKFEPGPGEYDPKDLNDSRIGIAIKSRIPPPSDGISPGFYKLPDLIGTGEGYSLGIKNFMERKDQSPGPIYQLPPPRPHPVSLTFRPFEMRGKREEPSPIEWGTKPAEAKIKVLPQAPRPFLHGTHETGLGKFKTPGPNQYDICDECPLCAEPGASFKGRYGTKIEETPGPAHYDPKPVWKRAPYPVFQHKHKERKKKDVPAAKPPGVDDLPKGRIIGGVMTPRWRDKEEDDDAPELLNIFGLNNKGPKKAIPISMKSRHSPFKYAALADPQQFIFDTGKDGKCT